MLTHIGWGRSRWGQCFAVPQFLLIMVFFVWPMLRVGRDAFYYVDPFGMRAKFSGFHNITEVLFEPSYSHALVTTVLLTGWIVCITTVLGLLIALVLHHVQKGRLFYKLLLLWPYAVAPAIAAVLWRFLFHPTLGWLSEWCTWLNGSFNYLMHPKLALAVVVIVSVWQQLSYNILFFFVSLESIPASILEAAWLEGASSWQCFWKIRLPMLRATLLFLVLMNALYAFFETFSVIDILTSGGPGDRTTTLLYKIYKDGFIGMDWSSAAVQSLLLMLMVVGITLLKFRYDKHQILLEEASS